MAQKTERGLLYDLIDAAMEDGREMDISFSDYEPMRVALLDYAEAQTVPDTPQAWKKFHRAMAEVERIDALYSQKD